VIAVALLPKAEFVHWWFATGFVVLALLLASEAVVGEEVWARRPWRRYLWPSVLSAMGVLMFPVMTFFTSSTIHMLAHGSWAQVMMLAGAAELGLARGKLRNPWWHATTSFALVVAGTAVIVHEQNSWFFERAAFLHHLIGWVAIGCAIFPLLKAVRPRASLPGFGLAATFATFAVILFCDRDIAPIFGHLSYLAGIPKR
jgi:hypothetical protein